MSNTSDRKKGKFDWMEYLDCETDKFLFAFNKRKYSKEDALKFIHDIYKTSKPVLIDKEFYVRYSFYINEYTDEVDHGYVVRRKPSRNSIEVWVFEDMEE